MKKAVTVTTGKSLFDTKVTVNKKKLAFFGLSVLPFIIAYAVWLKTVDAFDVADLISKKK